MPHLPSLERPVRRHRLRRNAQAHALVAALLLGEQAADGITHRGTSHRVRHPVLALLHPAKGGGCGQTVQPRHVVLLRKGRGQCKRHGAVVRRKPGLPCAAFEPVEMCIAQAVRGA